MFSQEMSLFEIRQGIGEVWAMIQAWSEAYEISFSPSFNVTGGEPFLRADLFKILEDMGRKGFDLYLLSNGILINRDKAVRLADLGIKGVQISLEGPEEIHESIRGKGSFSASLKGIAHLISEGITVTLNMTLSELNAGNISEMVELTKSLGLNRLGFSRLVPSGKGAGLLPYTLSRENVEDLGDVPLGGCAAGVSGLTILPDGTITPCRRLPVSVGNIRKDSLRELWVTSPILESLRDRSQYQGKCGSCKRWAACRGCRAIAYAYSQAKGEGHLLAEDPQCFLDFI
jgi:radical SAM protein with 4Fe4S-binding SPASM domain